MSQPHRPQSKTQALLPVRILICAADLVVRVGLAALLAEQERLLVAGQCTPDDDPATALSLFQPDVILWNLGWNADEMVATLSEFTEHGVPLLALVADDAESAALWSTGIRGLLLRDSSPDVLCDALVVLAHGLYLFDPAFAHNVHTYSTLETPVEPLTPRELEVLAALAQGLSNKLIARDLNISEHTVKFHINAILGKLGAQSRTDAVVRATRAGLIQL